MKKILSVVLAFVLLSLCVVPCFAESQSMTISTTGIVAYELSYPADIEIPWLTRTMGIGEIRAVLLSIEPRKAVTVSVSSANNYKLANNADASKTIAYTLSGIDDIKFLPGDYGKSYGLSVSVTDSQWKQASAGKHTDLLTFTAEYVDA